MTIETPHPPPEIMAAIAEGKLKRREIEPLLGHIEECAECRSEVELVSRSFRQEEPQARSGARFLRFGAAAAAAIAMMVVLAIVRPWSSRGSRSSIAALAALAPRSARVVEPRLSGGFLYAPFSGPMRANDPAAEADRLKLGGQAGIAIEQASRNSSPEAQHAAGVAYLLIDKPGQAMERLRAAAVQNPDNAAVWSDLAAAQYTDAVHVPAPSLLPQALASVDRALRIDPNNIEAHFNRALILERLGLIKQARSAWERYLTTDPSSAWAVEARSRLRALPSAEGDALFRRELPRIEKAAAANDATIVASAVRRWREQSRAWGEAEFLGRWGEAMQRGEAAEAARLLAVARSLGGTLREQSGERLLSDAVAAIDHADAATCATLAEAHATYRRGRIAYSRRQPSAAEPDLRRAAALFASGRSPMERMALYYAANTRYDQNDIATARMQLEALLAHEDSGYIASGALIRWQLSLCRNADGDAEGALALLAASASSLQRLDERNNLGFVESLLAVTLLDEGRPDEAWEARIRSFEALSTEGRGDRLLANLAGAVAEERRAGHTDAALALLGVEREAGRDVQDDVLLSGTLTRAAVLTAELGDIRGAARLLDDLRGVSARVTDPAFRSLVDANADVAQAAVTLRSDPALAVKNLTTAAGAFEQMGQHALAIDCYLLRARGETALGDFPAAARTVDEGLARFERFHVQLAGSAVDEGVLQSGSELIEEAIRLSLDRGETALAFGYAESARMRFSDAPASPAHAAAAAVQSRLAGSGAALVEVVVLPAETIIFSLDGSRLSVARQPLSREAMIGMVQRAAAGDREAATSLYDLLLRPGALVPQAHTLVVIPDPLLGSLPFAALYDAAAKRYLIEEVAVVLAESGASLRAPSPARPLAHVLAMSLPSGETLGSAALPETNAEVSDVVSSYSQGTALRDSQSTFAALVEGGRDADVIHLSGHTDEIGSGGTAALVFAAADGVKRERIPWKRIAAASFPRLQVAVLAACDTLRLPPRRAGARAPSLGGAFLAAGACSAVGTLRPIGDRDARLLFRALNQQLGHGVSVAGAVRNAQREAIASGASPAAWSAIAVLTREIPQNIGEE
jgi:tetratricopeptide (TPR) repeat protein